MSPPIQIYPPTGCELIAISGVTITVTSTEYRSSQPLSSAFTQTLYVVVALSAPVLYVF